MSPEQRTEQQTGPTGLLKSGEEVTGEALAALAPLDRKAAIGRYNVRGHAFKPGQSGNRAGRPKDRVSVTTALKSRLAKDAGLVNALVDAWLERALAESGTKDLAMILDRVDGAIVKQSVVESFAHVKRYGFAQPPTPEVRGEDGRTVEATIIERPGRAEKARLAGNLERAAEAFLTDATEPARREGPPRQWARTRLAEAPPPRVGSTVDSEPHPPENAQAPPDGTIQGSAYAEPTIPTPPLGPIVQPPELPEDLR